MNRLQKLAAAATAAALMAPAAASAQTVDVSSQVQSLLSQIRALQEQLKNLLASSTPLVMHLRDDVSTSTPGELLQKACTTIQRDLRTGAQGDDVRSLQLLLRSDEDSGFTGEATGFFGPLTANAVAKWQMKFGIASSTEGRVGPATRAFLKNRCGGDMLGATSTPDMMGPGMGEGRPMGGMLIRGASMIVGKVDTVSSASFTLKSEDESKTVLVNASTTISIYSTSQRGPQKGSMSDVVSGVQVRAIGTKNADGTLTASLVEVGAIRPMNR